ncbi:hypothetical protein GOBAR_DD31300 [Gossypium barbadense]|nr:hypothetical protein GOBAR_DD31300 [Gossypium barbadense]
MNWPKVAVGGLGFVFALNEVQHHRLGIGEFFSYVLVVVVVVYGRLVGERGDLGCQTNDGRSKRVAHGAGRLRRSELGYGFF